MKNKLKHLKTYENYTYEDFTMSDMEDVKELWNDGLTDTAQIAIEIDKTEDTVKQIIFSLKKSGDIINSI